MKVYVKFRHLHIKFKLAELFKRRQLSNLLSAVVSLRLIFKKKENLKYFVVFILSVALIIPGSFL